MTQPVGFYPKYRVEFAAEVLIGDYRRKFHQLFVGELFLQRSEEAVRDALSRVSHALGKLQGKLLPLAEKAAVLIVIKVSQLFWGAVLLRRSGRIDVDSKGAAVDPSRLGVDQVLQGWVD